MFIKLEFLFFSDLFSAAPVDRPSHTPENTIINTTASTRTTTLTSAGKSSSGKQKRDTVDPSRHLMTFNVKSLVL